MSSKSRDADPYAPTIYVYDHRLETVREAGFASMRAAEDWIEAREDGDRRRGARDPADATGRYEPVDGRPL